MATTQAAKDTRAVGKRPPGGRAPKKALSERARAERNLGIKLAAPAAIVMLAVTAYQIGYAVWLSMQRYDLRTPDLNKFVWFSNYATVLSSSVFWQAVQATVIITVFSVIIEFILGLTLALVMHRALFGRRTVRTAILVPYGIITVVAAFAFKFAVDPSAGFIGGDPLSTRWSSFAAIIATEVWKTTPFVSLLLLAGLAAVPEDLQEAAKVDGANARTRLFKVTLPNMKAAILVALLFRTLDAFRIFDTVYIQTSGALKTNTISMVAYNTLITRVNLGLGSAISVLLFLMVLLIAFIFVKGFKTDLGQVRGDG
ncbi:MAG: transporter permease [Frankiales bacterium]|nr:transporter permease [Frankiales bacterium]